jgi:hypothetical protein
VGWWASPEIAYFAIPVLIVVVAESVLGRIRVTLTEVGLAVLALVLGAMPWIVPNLSSGGASLHSGPQPDAGFLSHLETLRLHVLPIYLGLALPVSGRFVLPHEIGRAIEYAIAILGVAVCAILLRRRSAWLLVAMAVLFPFVYAASPATWYWQDGRYAIYLVPIAALLASTGVCVLGTAIGRWRKSARIRARSTVTVALSVLVLVVSGVTVADARLVAPFRPGSPSGPAATWTSWHADATGYASRLADGLRRAGITGAVAGYWIAEPLTFVSRGSITASDVRYDRRPRLLAEAERDGPAYLFVRPSRLATAAEVVGSPLLDPGCAVVSDKCLTPALFKTYLEQRGIRSHAVVIGDFVAIVPARRVDPPAVFRAEHIPF